MANRILDAAIVQSPAVGLCECDATRIINYLEEIDPRCLILRGPLLNLFLPHDPNHIGSNKLVLNVLRAMAIKGTDIIVLTKDAESEKSKYQKSYPEFVFAPAMILQTDLMNCFIPAPKATDQVLLNEERSVSTRQMNGFFDLRSIATYIKNFRKKSSAFSLHPSKHLAIEATVAIEQQCRMLISEYPGACQRVQIKTPHGKIQSILMNANNRHAALECAGENWNFVSFPDDSSKK